MNENKINEFGLGERSREFLDAIDKDGFIEEVSTLVGECQDTGDVKRWKAGLGEIHDRVYETAVNDVLTELTEANGGKNDAR